jgi:hypothetical protein
MSRETIARSVGRSNTIHYDRIIYHPAIKNDSSAIYGAAQPILASSVLTDTPSRVLTKAGFHRI